MAFEKKDLTGEDLSGRPSNFDVSGADMSEVATTEGDMSIGDLREMINDPRLDGYLDAPIVPHLFLAPEVPSLPAQFTEVVVAKVGEEYQLVFAVSLGKIAGLL